MRRLLDLWGRLGAGVPPALLLVLDVVLAMLVLAMLLGLSRGCHGA